VQLYDAPGLFAEADAIERWAVTIKTLTARRVEDAATWKRAGYRSVAEQMAAASGTSVSTARTLLETSMQLEDLPATADAMRAGKLSRAKAEVIASAATVAPEAEAGLSAGADAPVAVVRDACLHQPLHQLHPHNHGQTDLGAPLWPRIGLEDDCL
jgi:hypothetical protein